MNNYYLNNFPPYNPPVTYFRNDFSHHYKIKNEQKKIDTFKESKTKKADDCVIEIMGIKLFFDDILLICLIFFLYSEGIDDYYLFFVLVLLLLS